MFTILVVEDDAPLQRMMSAFLGLNGFSVVGAANGEEALNAIDRVMPDHCRRDDAGDGRLGADA